MLSVWRIPSFIFQGYSRPILHNVPHDDYNNCVTLCKGYSVSREVTQLKELDILLILTYLLTSKKANVSFTYVVVTWFGWQCIADESVLMHLTDWGLGLATVTEIN